MSVESMKCRGAVGILTVKRVIRVALQEAEGKAGKTWLIHPPSDVQRIAIPMRGVVRKPRQSENPRAVVAFVIADRTRVIRAGENGGAGAYSTAIGKRLRGGV